MNIKKIFCYLKAIPFWFVSGIFCPHVFVNIDNFVRNVIATENSFRISDSFEHSEDERVYKSAIVSVAKCKHCGEISMAWTMLDVKD